MEQERRGIAFSGFEREGIYILQSIANRANVFACANLRYLLKALVRLQAQML